MVASARPSLRFFHATALRARTNRLLAAIERDADATEHAASLSSLVVELTRAGLDYYFLRPLTRAKIGFVARQSARLGLAGVLRLMSPMIGRVLAGANSAQLREIARHIRQLM